MRIVGWARLSPSPDLLRLSFTSKMSCSCPRCTILDHVSASATADMCSTPTAVRIPPDLVDARSCSTLYDDAVPPWDVGRSRGGTARRPPSFISSYSPTRSIWRVRVSRRRGRGGAGCMWGAGHRVRAQSRVDRAPMGHGRRVACFHFAGVALMGAGRGAGRGEEGRRRCISRATRTRLIRERARCWRWRRSFWIWTRHGTRDGRPARRGGGESWMWDVRGRVARLRLLPVPASALGPSLPQSQLEQWVGEACGGGCARTSGRRARM
ncbi:hypothetical protein DFH08DRAFT_323155 [Mycena albidolilacea]|uniref:Uncharacterized protein n=1 Tax=Mycena albidolilacea TaxID=1033008 RepID=A0AAD7ALM2_9AGAR|nr:hypothetical protein DFH08DRAFT_323155 [Mycena albidolilacea]